MPKSKSVQTWLPAAMVEALDQARGATDQNRSSFIREALAMELRRRGYWPPKGVDAPEGTRAEAEQRLIASISGPTS